jgi:NAD(P)-dependent dehydrogenase (short-subunit alcohol dehydrogenase family)
LKANRFQDKVVLVTGGNSGIGRAAALMFAREGACVVIAARREDRGNAVLTEIKNMKGKARFVRTDVTKIEDIENLFKVIGDEYGRLDCAFNNAGVSSPTMRRIVNTTMDEWDWMMNTNLKGVWRCMKYEIPLMLKQGGGAIVNNSSIAGIHTEVGLSVYAASKHGVLGLTRAAALDYAHRKIRINAVCPGFIHTPMLEEPWRQNPQVKNITMALVPMKRFGKPEEIAGAVLWMCSEEASFMTGKEMVIGGGQAIHS